MQEYKKKISQYYPSEITLELKVEKEKFPKLFFLERKQETR